MGFGFGRISWVGCGRMNSSIHFCIKMNRRVGSIFTEQVRALNFSTVIETNAGSSNSQEIIQIKIIFSFYQTKY